MRVSRTSEQSIEQATREEIVFTCTGEYIIKLWLGNWETVVSGRDGEAIKYRTRADAEMALKQSKDRIRIRDDVRKGVDRLRQTGLTIEPKNVRFAITSVQQLALDVVDEHLADMLNIVLAYALEKLEEENIKNVF